MDEQGVERRLAAILVADVVGYSRLMAADERGTHARLKLLRREVIDPLMARHKGRIVKLMGDGALAEFASVVDAVECAAAIQKRVAEQQEGVPEDHRIAFRIGINLGDIIVEGDDIYGSGVNVAARLEGLADPGGICVSRSVYNQVKDKVEFGFEPAGEHRVKNIAEPVVVYRVLPDPGLVAKALGVKRIGTPRWRLAALPAAAVLVLGAVVAWLWPSSNETSTALTDMPAAQEANLDRQRLAVLPLANISTDPNDEYFSDGMTEELISKLSRLRNLTVIARTSVMQYKHTDKSIAQIGQELRVGTILEGSVRKIGDRLRITTQLIDVASQGHLWSADYNRDLKDVFAIQSDVAQNVADALRVALLPGERQQISRQETTNLDAYNLYLRGLYHWNKLTKDNLEKAQDYFEEAINLDQTYAQAYAWLAYCYQVLGEFGHMSPREAYPEAKIAAQRALELDPTNADAYAVLATVRGYYDWDWVGSENAYKKAIELNPGSVVAHWNYGILLLTPLLRHDESIASLKRALELEPLAPWIGADLAWAFNSARRFDEAIQQSQHVIDLDPNFPLSHASLGYAYLLTERHEEALAEFQKEVELTGGEPFAVARLGWAYGMAGQTSEARKVLNELREYAEQGHVDPLAFAWIYIGLGDKEAAFLWLEAAYGEKSELDNQPQSEGLLRSTALRSALSGARKKDRAAAIA